MPWGAAAALAGAYLSYSSAEDQAAATKEAGKADPRFNLLLYGDGSKENPGLLNQSQNWYNENRTGMNDQMRQGMNDQWGILTDPALRAGYNNMSNLGGQLMNQPVAGNPFTSGRASLDKPFDPMAGRTQMAPSLLNSQSSGPGPDGFYGQPGLQNNRPDYFAQPHEAGRYGQQGLIGNGGPQQPAPQQPGPRPPGLLNNAPFNQPTQPGQNAPQAPGLPGWNPAQFGGPAAPGGAPAAPGPFTAPAAPVAAAPVDAGPAKPPGSGPYTNRPFDPAAFAADFWTRYSNGTATPADIAEYNTISNRNAG